MTPDGETTLCVTYYDADDRIERQENTTLAGVIVTEYRYDERTGDPAEQRVLSDGEELARRVMTYDRLDAQGNWTRCVISAVDAQGVRDTVDPCGADDYLLPIDGLETMGRNRGFRFKRFAIEQTETTMKVGDRRRAARRLGAH